MFKKIMIPLDGSALAENALEPGLALAERSGADVVLLRVPVYWEVPAAAATYEFLRPEQTRERIYERAERYLRSIRQVKHDLSIPLQLQVAEGDVAGTIVDTAAASGIDLIVMSTHGRTGLRRWLLGSVTEKVLRSAPCPVLAVRSNAIPVHVLIPLDGSEAAERVLEPALAIARSGASRVTLLRVLEPPEHEIAVPGMSSEAAYWLRDELQSISCQEAESYLQHVVATYQQANEEIEAAVVTGAIPEAILDFAERGDVDLIAMSTHGQSAQARWAYGSVTERVVHGATCAVLVAPVTTSS